MGRSMSTDDPRAALRGALYRADGRAVVAALSTEDWHAALQLGGDGLLVALGQGVDGAPQLADRCATALRERAWEGDDDLAEQLEAALGQRPAPPLRPLPVDLEELADVLEGDPAHGGGRIDLRTGEVWPQSMFDDAGETDDEDDEDDDEDSDHWLAVWCEGSREGYRDMEDFVATVADDERTDRLLIALSGRGAFRRFKDVLARWPEELQRWFAFSDERQRGRARSWLVDAGYSSCARRSSELA
jgi:hypothetical protein